MAINGINQVAINAYNSVNSSVPTKPSDSVAFQDMVNVNFNKLASMTPAQILDHISAARINSARPEIMDVLRIGQGSNTMGDTLRKHERLVNLSLTGDASLQEVMAAANEASNVVKTATTLRNKLFEAFDKIMNMQI